MSWRTSRTLGPHRSAPRRFAGGSFGSGPDLFGAGDHPELMVGTGLDGVVVDVHGWQFVDHHAGFATRTAPK